MSENAFITKAAGIVGSATFFSRVLGYIRDMVMAGFFGAGFYSDAFIAAFRIPNLFRRLFAEGTLSIAFVPVFTEVIQRKGRDEAFHMARSAVKLLSVILAVVAVIGVLFSPDIMRVVAYGFSPEKLSLTIVLTRIMFPYVIMICLVALSMGILNVLGHFAAPALAPVMLNIAMIASMFLVSRYTSDRTSQVIGLAAGVLAGGILQLMLQAPFLIKKGFYFWQKSRLYHPDLNKIIKLMPFAIIGAAVYQINILVGIYFASTLYEGSITYLYYAERLLQFPLGIFAISIATAVMPSISRQAAMNDMNAVKDTFSYAMKLIFFIMFPSMAGMIILREPIVALLFQRVAFDSIATKMTACALLYGCTGLWAVSAVRIAVYTFYAIQDMKTPVYIAGISIAANIIFSAVLIKPLGHGGLALATSLASMLNLILLVWALRIKLGALGIKSIMVSACKYAVCSVIMSAAVWRTAFYLIPRNGVNLLYYLMGLTASISAGIILYLLLTFLIKSAELETIMSIAKGGAGKNEN